MLERYFVKPTTADRIRASWIGSEIEQYVEWLAEPRAGRTPAACSGRCNPSSPGCRTPNPYRPRLGMTPEQEAELCLDLLEGTITRGVAGGWPR